MAKILVIDDSRMMRLYLGRCLTQAGHDVEEWLPGSAMEVTEHVEQSRPDLILTDYQMPGCNGATVARMAGRSEPKVPVVILTAFKDEDMVQNLRKLGVEQVLTKPIAAEALVGAVTEALGG
ncbi:response regulator [Mesoterricola sediminis]|uniref:Response regulator n=1 Tax=Mesoterricola sediminis TaxID=2927980 RepID=A0AA48GYR9_9BACT|nr:response regulator [Mesoterricola sediminis]BDU76502.1 response regulator [Mesoterricola sediminis]